MNDNQLREQLAIEEKKLESITIEFNFVIGRQRGRVELLQELLGMKEEESVPSPEVETSE